MFPLIIAAQRLLWLLTYLLTHSLTHSLTYLLTHLLTYLLTHLLTYLLIYLLIQVNILNSICDNYESMEWKELATFTILVGIWLIQQAYIASSLLLEFGMEYSELSELTESIQKLLIPWCIHEIQVDYLRFGLQTPLQTLSINIAGSCIWMHVVK
jgi:hypothetical protein